MTTEQIQEAYEAETPPGMSFVRCYDFGLVPRRLFDQLKGSSFNYDLLMAHGAMICLNATQLLYVLVDGDSVIHGVLWAEYDAIQEWVYVNCFSVDPEYQDRNQVNRAVEFLRDELKDSVPGKRIVMATTRPAAYEKYGFKKTEATLMEIEL